MRKSVQSPAEPETVNLKRTSSFAPLVEVAAHSATERPGLLPAMVVDESASVPSPVSSLFYKHVLCRGKRGVTQRCKSQRQSATSRCTASTKVVEIITFHEPQSAHR